MNTDSSPLGSDHPRRHPRRGPGHRGLPAGVFRVRRRILPGLDRQSPADHRHAGLLHAVCTAAHGPIFLQPHPGRQQPAGVHGAATQDGVRLPAAGGDLRGVQACRRNRPGRRRRRCSCWPAPRWRPTSGPAPCAFAWVPHAGAVCGCSSPPAGARCTRPAGRCSPWRWSGSWWSQPSRPGPPMHRRVARQRRGCFRRCPRWHGCWWQADWSPVCFASSGWSSTTRACSSPGRISARKPGAGSRCTAISCASGSRPWACSWAERCCSRVLAGLAVGGSLAAATSGKPLQAGTIIAFLVGGIAFVFGLFLISAPARAYREARMFQLVWNNVGVSTVARFKCELRAKRYVMLRVRNMFLTLLTLGFFRPFAMVSEYRMKTEAVTLHVKGGLDQLVGPTGAAAGRPGRRRGRCGGAGPGGMTAWRADPRPLVRRAQQPGAQRAGQPAGRQRRGLACACTNSHPAGERSNWATPR